MKKQFKKFIALLICAVTTMASMNIGIMSVVAATGVYKDIDVVSTTNSSISISQLTVNHEYKVRDEIISLNESSVNRMASEHFQIIWGNSNTANTDVNYDFIKGNLINLENIRTFYIERLGMNDICYSMTSSLSGKYKTNIYVSNTGLSGFEDDWAYMSSDSQGFAYLFLNPDAMRVDEPSWVVPHELAHAFTYHQGGTIDYAWYEATANWFRDQYLGSEYYAYGNNVYGPDSDFFGPYMINGEYYVPHMLNWYDTWPIFLYISENPDNIDGLGLDLMHKIFSNTQSDNSMYATIERLSGVSIKTILGGMTKRLATMDFSRQPYYIEELNNLISYDSSNYGKIYTTLQAADSQGYQSVNLSDAPMQTGFNIIPLNVDLSKNKLEVDFINTSTEKDSDFRTSLVTKTTNNTTRYSNMISGSGSASIMLNGDEVEAYLVVCAVPDTLKGYQVDWDSKETDTDTRYTYKVKITSINNDSETESTTELLPVDPSDTAVMGTYVFGTDVVGGDFNITSKAATTLGNVSFGFRDMKSDGAKTRKNDNNINVKFTLNSETNVTLTSSGKGMVAVSSTGVEYEFEVGTTTVKLPAGTYTIQGSSTTSNSTLTKMVLSLGSSVETTTESTTTAETTTKETMTEATTQAPVVDFKTITDNITYSKANFDGNMYFNNSDATNVYAHETQDAIRLKAKGSITFTVEAGAMIKINACGANATDATRTITLSGPNTNKTVTLGVSGDYTEAIYGENLGAGSYTLKSNNDVNINLITITFPIDVIKGDVDNNGKVENADVSMLLKYVVKAINSVTNSQGADVNVDNMVDITDAYFIQRFINNGQWD